MITESENFRAYLIRQGLHKRTVYQHVNRLKILLSEVDEFSYELVEQYLTKRIEKGVSGSTINKYVQTIKKYCLFKDFSWGKKVQKVREVNKTKILMSDDEISSFIELNPPPSKMGVFWSCVAYTGARLNEVLNLKVNDIDTANKLLIFQDTKTGQGRTAPLPDTVMDNLLSYTKKIPNGYIFPTKVNQCTAPDYSKAMSYTIVSRDFHTRKKELGIAKDIKPYSLRHSFINRLLTDAEAPLFVVQDIVGHKSAETTRRYYHGSVKAMHKAIQKDPLMRQNIKPQILLSQLINYIRDFLSLDKRFSFEIEEKEGEVNIKIRVKKKDQE